MTLLSEKNCTCAPLEVKQEREMRLTLLSGTNATLLRMIVYVLTISLILPT